MGQLIPWIQVTISGFVYVSALFFLLLSLAGKYDLIFKEVHKYVPYIAILLIFLSYVIGYSIHLSFEWVLLHLCPSLKEPIKNLIYIQNNLSENLYKSFNDGYSNLVMLRHLFIATLLLGMSLYNWFRKSNMKIFKWYALIICILFAVIFIIAYDIKRTTLIEFKQSILEPQ